jgi:hypothetical protein
MSRTDIHRPIHALWLDPMMRRHFHEIHRHQTGDCDLPAFLESFEAGNWIDSNCYVQWYSDLRICSCEGCSQRIARRRARRAERQTIRRELRAAAGRRAAGDLTDDPVVPRRYEMW